MVNDGIGEENLKDGDEPMIEATIEGEGAFVLILYIPVMGMHVEFTFTFLPVARESLDTDILEKQLRDAEEEIDKLKNEVTGLKEEVTELREKRNDLIVLVPGGCSRENILVWNPIIHNSPSAVYELSVDRQSIKILQAGVYQIACRLSYGPIRLEVNEVDIAVVNNVSKLSANFCDIFQLQINDVLTLRGELNVHKDINNFTLAYRLSILKLIV
jgi:hypothetical protein